MCIIGKRGSLEGWSAEPQRRGLCAHTYVHVCSRVWMCVCADTRLLVTSVVREYHKTTQRNRALCFHNQGSWERHNPLTEYSLHTLRYQRLSGALLSFTLQTISAASLLKLDFYNNLTLSPGWTTGECSLGTPGLF